MGKKEAGKPRGRMTPYACFVQVSREEQKKKHPNESIVFAEFSKKCAEKWKSLGAKDKKRFEDMAERDKQRYEKEMANYTPAAGAKGGKGKKKKKDPNAPKRSLSAFFFFCQEERGSVRAKFPDWGVGDVAKELGKRWELCSNRTKYEQMATKDKARYEKEIAEYRKKQGGAAAAKKPAAPAKGKGKAAAAQDDDDDDEDDDDDDDDDDEDDD